MFLLTYLKQQCSLFGGHTEWKLEWIQGYTYGVCIQWGSFLNMHCNLKMLGIWTVTCQFAGTFDLGFYETTTFTWFGSRSISIYGSCGSETSHQPSCSPYLRTTLLLRTSSPLDPANSFCYRVKLLRSYVPRYSSSSPFNMSRMSSAGSFDLLQFVD